MVFKWFDAETAKSFGKSLATFFMERVPLESAVQKKKSAAKTRDVLNKMFLQVDKFKVEHKLNVYKKAQLANTFKWTLKEAGYDDPFVDEVTNLLMIRF